jgi:hypothetical protein
LGGVHRDPFTPFTPHTTALEATVLAVFVALTSPIALSTQRSNARFLVMVILRSTSNI